MPTLPSGAHPPAPMAAVLRAPRDTVPPARRVDAGRRSRCGDSHGRGRPAHARRCDRI